MFFSLSFAFPEAGLTAALAVCIVSMFSALKALPWRMTAKHYCFCRVHWHLYVLNNVCENETMRYVYAVERWAEGRSYLSAIRHDRLISEILNCKTDLILAEMKVVALILSVVWTKAIYSFAKNAPLPELFWNQCKVVAYSEYMQWSKTKQQEIYLRLYKIDTKGGFIC